MTTAFIKVLEKVGSGWRGSHFFLLAVVFSTFVNVLNYSYIVKRPELAQRNLVKGKTIYSNDNIWYLPQVYNWAEGHGYTIDPDNEYMRVRRTPGYSVFFGMHYVLLGEELAYSLVRLTQILLFGLSALLFWRALGLWGLDPKAINLASALYATSPFIAGYHFHTITESIHPSLMVMAFYFYSRAYHKEGYLSWIVAGIVAALMVLVRPVDGLVLVFWGLMILRNRLWTYKARFIIASMFGMGFLLIVSPWIVRNYVVSREFIPLEKFYNGDPMGWGKGHMAFRRWWSGWENPEVERYLTPMINVADSAREHLVQELLLEVPTSAFRGSSKSEVGNALESMLDCYNYKRSRGLIRNLQPGEKIPGCEEEIYDRFTALHRNYRSSNPLEYYVLTPLSLVKTAVWHSYSSMYLSLNPASQDFTWVQLIIKSLMFALNISLFISIPLMLYTPRIGQNLKWLLVGFPLSNMILFIFGFRYIEARYLLQLYPFMCISLGIVAALSRDKLRHRIGGGKC